MVTRFTALFVIFSTTLLLASMQSFATEKYYKVVRADGSVEYTMEKPSAESKPVDLPGLSIISPERKQAPTTSQPVPNTESNIARTETDYSGIQIISPAEQDNLWGTEGTITVEVGLPNKLSNGAKIQLSLDGKNLPALESTSFTLKDVYRGEHKLVASVISANGKVLASSPTRTFYIMMANIRR